MKRRLGCVSGRSIAAQDANRMLDKIRAGINHAYRKIIFMTVNNGLLPCDPLFATCYLLLGYRIEQGEYGQPDVSSRYRVVTLLSDDTPKDDFAEFEGIK